MTKIPSRSRSRDHGLTVMDQTSTRTGDGWGAWPLLVYVARRRVTQNVICHQGLRNTALTFSTHLITPSPVQLSWKMKPINLKYGEGDI